MSDSYYLLTTVDKEVKLLPKIKQIIQTAQRYSNSYCNKTCCNKYNAYNDAF